MGSISVGDSEFSFSHARDLKFAILLYLSRRKIPGKRDGPAGRKSGAQRKAGLVGERQLQPYAPHGAMRNN